MRQLSPVTFSYLAFAGSFPHVCNGSNTLHGNLYGGKHCKCTETPDFNKLHTCYFNSGKVLTRLSCTYTQFRFHRQFCSWVSSHVGIPVASSLEEELSRLGNTRGPYSSRAEKTKQSTTNDSLLSTAGKEDSVPPCINDGRIPGWCWQGVNGGPRAFLHSHHLQPAGRSLLGALPWFSVPAVRGRRFRSIPRVLEIKRFLLRHPWNGKQFHRHLTIKPLTELPSGNDVGFVLDWNFGAGGSAEAVLQGIISDMGTLLSLPPGHDLPHTVVTNRLQHGKEKYLASQPKVSPGCRRSIHLGIYYAALLVSVQPENSSIVLALSRSSEGLCKSKHYGFINICGISFS